MFRERRKFREASPHDLASRLFQIFKRFLNGLACDVRCDRGFSEPADPARKSHREQDILKKVVLAFGRAERDPQFRAPNPGIRFSDKDLFHFLLSSLPGPGFDMVKKNYSGYTNSNLYEKSTSQRHLSFEKKWPPG
jgi:hypothetical protein